MAVIDAGSATGLQARAAPRASQVAAVTAGNALEFYDFLTYAFFAAQIGRTFFPSADASVSLLASLATFGAGFLMRPVGALVIGRIGDRRGRKPAMLLSFGLMGTAMLGLAMTPSYRAIGVAGPVLAILFRLTQGFALGGEVGPNTAYLVEAAPPHRRGLYVSFQYMSQDLSVLCSGLVGYVLSSHISAAALDAWGWRVAFLLGAAIVPFGLVLRRGLIETLHQPAHAAVPPAPPQRLGFLGLVLLSLVLLAGGTIGTYVLSYLTTYATETLRMPTTVGFLAPIAIGVVGVVFDPLGGWLSDRFGRKPVMLIAWVFLFVAAVPAFRFLARDRSVEALLLLTVTLQIALCISGTSVLVAVTEGLPRAIRCGSLGLIYAFAISVFGGSTQFTVAWLTKVTGNPVAPAWYMTTAAAVALGAMLLLKESAPRRLERQAANLSP